MQYCADLQPLHVGPGRASSDPGKPSSSLLVERTLNLRRVGRLRLPFDEDEEEEEDEAEEVAELGAIWMARECTKKAGIYN